MKFKSSVWSYWNSHLIKYQVYSPQTAVMEIAWWRMKNGILKDCFSSRCMEGRRLLGLAVLQIFLFGEWFSLRHTLVFHKGGILSFFFSFPFLLAIYIKGQLAKTATRTALRWLYCLPWVVLNFHIFVDSL